MLESSEVQRRKEEKILGFVDYYNDFGFQSEGRGLSKEVI